MSVEEIRLMMKLHGLTPEECRCDNLSPGFMAYLKALGRV